LNSAKSISSICAVIEKSIPTSSIVCCSVSLISGFLQIAVGGLCEFEWNSTRWCGGWYQWTFEIAETTVLGGFAHISMDPRNLCGFSQPGALSHRLTLSQRSLSQNHSFSWILFGCRKRCSWVLTICSLACSCIGSPHRSQI
jgi:hypothetical protein